MSEITTKVRALVKAQSALMRIELQAKSTQAVYGALALVFGLLGLGMLNVGAFFALVPAVGEAWAAIILGGADMLLAVAIVKAASGVTTGPAGESARELRDMVVESLSEDAERIGGQIQGVQDDITRARKALSRSSSNLLPGISSVVGMLSTALTKSKKKKS